ncbi:MAG: PAS domain-containing protein, partial [Bacteroidetes bacterium]|nr:PAS domain-containing protein [Bacteroidota bacterium]
MPKRQFILIMDVSKTFLQQLAKQSKDLTFVYDMDARCFAYLSDSAVDFFGISPEKIYKSPEALITLLQEEDRQHVLDQVDKIKKGAPYVDIEFRLQMPDGTIKWLHAKAYTLHNKENNKVHMAGILEDITPRKEHEISLYTIKEQKDTVLQILGHDLRGPLHTITGATELIHREIGKNEAAMQRIHQYLTIISTTCEHSLSLINEVLSIEYMEAQKVALKKIRFDLVARIRNQIDTYRLIRNNNKDFMLNSSRDKIFATLDPTRYTLIIENLLSNAYKFTRADGCI